MNKRQKKKRIEREKKEIIRGIDFLETAFTQAAEQMRLEYHKMSQGEEKAYHDFFIAGFEYATKMLDVSRNLIGNINEV